MTEWTEMLQREALLLGDFKFTYLAPQTYTRCRPAKLRFTPSESAGLRVQSSFLVHLEDYGISSSTCGSIGPCFPSVALGVNRRQSRAVHNIGRTSSRATQ